MGLARLIAAALFFVPLAGCGIETVIFPMLEPALFEESPATMGPYGFAERRIALDDLGDGQSGDLTVFEPVGATGPRPTLVWVLGVNNEAHYHQSFHEYMASWGYIDVVPDTRPISFADREYNKRNMDIANRAFALAADKAHGLNADPQQIAFGGYSAGGSTAALAAAGESRTRALVMWAPAPAWVWQGVDPNALLPRVTAPSLFLLAELENNDGSWTEDMRALMTQSQQTITTIAGGTHLYFQQPAVPYTTDPPARITRTEQMKQAFELTRAFLDAQFGLTR